MDCKSSRHVSEQLSSPTCSTQPSGRGSPRRAWARRLHCAQRMVTSGAYSVMAALLLVLAWVAAPCRTAKASGARHPWWRYHTIKALKPCTPDDLQRLRSTLRTDILPMPLL